MLAMLSLTDISAATTYTPSQLFCGVPFTTKTWRKSSCPVSGCTSLTSLFQMKTQILVSLREIALQQPLSPLKYGVWITILDISSIKQWNDSLFWNDLDCNPWYEAWLSCHCIWCSWALCSFCSFSEARCELSESDSAVRVSGSLVGLNPPYSDTQMLWTWARYTLPFNFLSYKMGRDAATHKMRPFVDQESSTQHSFEHLVLVTIYVFSWRKASYH